MTEKMLDVLGKCYPLTAIDIGEFAALRVSGMQFTVQAYHAEGLGHVSLMQAKGFLGLMKMDTLMIVPKEKDLPLYSYDRIFAMGNDTLIVELYDTLTSPLDLSSLGKVKTDYAHLLERDPGKHWYDHIKLPESISKKGKKAKTPSLNAMAEEHFRAYLALSGGEVVEKERKASLSSAYVEGLLQNGGPSTDVFKKSLGQKKTERLFKEVLFGTK